MLNNVPNSVNTLSRRVVINHPNTLNCNVVRKTLNRVGETLMGGIPTLGGLGVLEDDDETNISWSIIGNAFAMRISDFEPSFMMDRGDANNGYGDEYRYLIEPEPEADDDDSFEIKKDDVIYLLYEGGVKIALEIIEVETVSNIPPYTKRYVCNVRDDLHII